MRDYFKQVCLVLLVFALTKISSAQTVTSDVAAPTRFATAGGIVGFGNAFSDNTFYKIFFFAGDFSWSFKKYPQKKDFVAWYAEPQFNLVHTLRPLDIEFGTNLGIRNYVRVNESLYFYQMLGSGPHYISARLDRQATGFIFSDNLAVGAYTRLNRKKLFLNLQFRMRHISNAGIHLPNRGVNSYNFFVGLSRFR